MVPKNKKTILITGGAGFIGSAFVNMLSPRYPSYQFVIVDSLTEVSDKRNITVLGRPNVSFVKCDIRNKKTLKQVFDVHKPTDIIHFAAETHVDVSIKKPDLFIETNVIGTGNLLALALSHNIERFHHISTDEVCGALSLYDAPITEEAPLLPNNPYSASKAAAECLVRAYIRTFGINAVITRCANNYGPRQDASKFIPLFIARFMAGKPAPLYGKGEHVRDWLYVDDHVEALDLVFHKGENGEIYNIGGGRELRNIDVAKKLASLLGKDSSLISFVADRPGHDLRYALDTTKIERELGWRPMVSFEEGLKMTVAFYAAQNYRTRPRRR